jgi:regulator of sigma E protease
MHFSLNGIVATVIALSVLVFVHELAHFIVAKACGVKVEVFSLGFGRRIIGFQHKETDYRISMLPLGGYVKMAGEIPGEETTGSSEEFVEHPRWQRALIAVAGPTSNVLLAIVVLTGVYMRHNEVEKYLSQPVVLEYIAKTSVAAKDGFQTGDRVVRVDSVKNPTWWDFMVQSALGADHKVSADVLRDGNTIPLTFTPDGDPIGEDGFVPIMSDGPLKVEGVETDMPAGRAGLKPGDEILAVDTQPIHSIYTFKAYLQDHNAAPVMMTVQRNGQTLKMPIQPALVADAAGGPQYQIGIRTMPPPAINQKQNLPDAFKHSIQTNIKNSTLIFATLRRMFSFRLSPKQVAGPIGIVQMASETAQEPGWTPLLSLMAMISLNLAIVNLLPFPILDGGVILLLAIEGLMRRDLKPQIKERVYQGAFVILAVLFMLLIFNDISKLSLFAHAKS